MIRLNDTAAITDGNAFWTPPPTLAAQATEFCRRRNVKFALSLSGDRLCIAMLAPGEIMDPAAIFDKFDMGNCGGFCRAAEICLEVTRAINDDAAVWAE